MEQILKQNLYFANPENILLAMINERKQLKTAPIQRILKSRNTNELNRHFKLPTILNLGAKDFCELVNGTIGKGPCKPLYAAHISLQIVVAGRIHSCIIGINVAASRFCTGIKKPFLVAGS